MRLLFTHTLLLLLFSLSALAQLSEVDKSLAEAIEIGAGGTFGRAKSLKKTDKLILAQLSVSFKQMTTKALQMTEQKRTLFGKTAGKSATLSLTAYLETNESELSNIDYLERINHFYQYFHSTSKEKKSADKKAFGIYANAFVAKIKLSKKD
jgi:hypothetical protein